MDKLSGKIPNKRVGFSIVYLIAAYLMLILVQRMLDTPGPKKVEYSEFLELIRAGKVGEVKFVNTEIQAKYRSAKEKEEPARKNVHRVG